jgi:multiple sugar transport system ATP-binding protein
LGDRTLVHVTLGEGTSIVAEDTGMSRVKVGDTVGLSFDGAGAHLFDAQRGYHCEPESEA